MFVLCVSSFSCVDWSYRFDGISTTCDSTRSSAVQANRFASNGQTTRLVAQRISCQTSSCSSTGPAQFRLPAGITLFAYTVNFMWMIELTQNDHPDDNAFRQRARESPAVARPSAAIASRFQRILSLESITTTTTTRRLAGVSTRC